VETHRVLDLDEVEVELRPAPEVARLLEFFVRAPCLARRLDVAEG
jgi:hypothetical protein